MKDGEAKDKINRKTPLPLIVPPANVFVAAGTKPYEIWVAPNGDDLAAGTAEQPLATLARAVRRGRELRRLNAEEARGGIRIILRGGVYPMSVPVWLRPEDAGSPANPTFIQAAPGEQPILSGGVEIGGWTRVEGAVEGLPAAAQGKLWAAPAPKFNGRLLEAASFGSATPRPFAPARPTPTFFIS